MRFFFNPQAQLTPKTLFSHPLEPVSFQNCNWNVFPRTLPNHFEPSDKHFNSFTETPLVSNVFNAFRFKCPSENACLLRSPLRPPWHIRINAVLMHHSCGTEFSLYSVTGYFLWQTKQRHISSGVIADYRNLVFNTLIDSRTYKHGRALLFSHGWTD